MLEIVQWVCVWYLVSGACALAAAELVHPDGEYDALFWFGALCVVLTWPIFLYVILRGSHDDFKPQ